MAQEEKEKIEKRDGSMVKISLISLLIVLLFIVEIYEIINDPNNLIAIGSLGVFLLVAVYAETVLIQRLSIKKAKEQEDAYNNIYRSEKASYLLMRKYFDKMDQKMGAVGGKSDLSFDELITSQKALAKVQINRNKHNTTTLLNANNRILEKLNDLQKKIENINTVSSVPKEIETPLIQNDSDQEMLAKQQEIILNLKEMEASLRNDIMQSTNKIVSMKQQMPAFEEPQLRSLDADNSFSDDSDLISQTVTDNSSESDLDRLLKDVENGFTAEATDPQVTEIPELEPIESTIPSLEEPELGPIVSELEMPELDPIMPGSEMPELGPIMPGSEMPEIGPLSMDISEQVDEKEEIADIQPIDIGPIELEGTETAPMAMEIPEPIGPMAMDTEPELIGSMAMDTEPEIEPMEMEIPEIGPMTMEIPEPEPVEMDTPEIEPMTLEMPESGSTAMEIPESESMAMEISEPGSTEIMSTELPDLEPIVTEMPASEPISMEASASEPQSEIEKIMQGDFDNILEDPFEDIDISDMPDESDTNHVMSAEEVAALIANTESFSEPEDQEDTQTMPDLSDPTHVMTSDEIAALIANL